MIGYWLLLLPTAIFAYALGSMDTLVLSSNFVFRRNLHRLGQGDQWISNFRRIFGLKGALLLLAVELVKDLLPIGFGALLLLIKDQTAVGAAFACFCLVLGRLFPVFYEFRGSYASVALLTGAFLAGGSVGVAGLVVLGLVTWYSRYFSLGAVAEAAVVAVAALVLAEDPLVGRLIALAAALMIIKNIPALVRIGQHREFRFSKQEDITYKLDEKF